MYARGRRDPFAAAEVAVALDVHQNVARRRLDRLVEAGFLTVALERLGGRRGPGAGRPAKVYRVAPELEGVEFPDRRLAALIGLLIARVPARGRQQAVRNVGEDFGRQLAVASGLKPARDVKTGLERICDALGSLGYAVSVASLQGERAELATPTCPLRPLVVECPDSNGIDHGMWAGLVACGVRGLAADGIQCETPTCQSKNASCRILLSLDRDTPHVTAQGR